MKSINKIISKATFLLFSSFILTSTSITYAEVETAEILTVAAIEMDKTVIYDDSDDKEKKGKGEEEPDCE